MSANHQMENDAYASFGGWSEEAIRLSSLSYNAHDNTDDCIDTISRLIYLTKCNQLDYVKRAKDDLQRIREALDA